MTIQGGITTSPFGPTDLQEAVDAILILGAAVWADGPSPTLRRRAQHGAALWHAGLAPIIVASGGLGRHPPTESAAIADILRNSGVPDAAIFQETRSTTTIENVLFALPLLKSRGVRSIAIVTDKTHAPRARLVARHFGLQASSHSPSLRGANIPVLLRQTIREAFAYPAYALKLRRMGTNS